MEDKLQSELCASYLRALADPQRLKLVECLQDGPKNVSQLSELVQDELANVSHHLGVMRRAGLVEAKRSGRQVVYSLAPAYYRPKQSQGLDVLDLGCCQFVLGSPSADGKTATGE
jgi:ArsR family transcriptional regulator